MLIKSDQFSTQHQFNLEHQTFNIFAKDKENMRGFIYILFSISIINAFPNYECEKNIFNYNCYSIHTSSGKLSYNEAKTKCQKMGGKLAQITNQNTHDFIAEMILTASHNHSGDSLWIEFDTQRLDGSWTSAKSRTNRYHYSRPRVSCTRLDMKSLKAAQTSCRHLYYPMCQYQTINCSIDDIAVSFTNFGICNLNDTKPFNTTITIACVNGYILQGPDKVTCQANGSWDHIPKCIAKCLPPLVNDGILIHNFKPEYNIGDEVLLVCHNGYFPGGKYLKSHHIATCKSNGKWENLNTVCIHEDQLNCPADICQSIHLHLEIDQDITLNCTGNEEYGVDIWPHFHWLKDHDRMSEKNSKYKLERDGTLEISKFQPPDGGIYTCVRGLNENHVEKVVIYDIRLKYKCEIDQNNNLPIIIVPEDTSVYLKSKGDGLSAINVAWFKDGRRIWGDKQRIILPSGDLLIHRTTHSDQGYFTFEIENEIYTDKCIDRTVKLSIMPRSSSICGLAEPVHPHPWLTSLWWNQETSPFCYGVLINEQWVLTSAFCLSRFYRLKEHNVSAGFENGNKLAVERFIVHPFYSKRLNVNDVGLLKLTTPVVFTHLIRPICIPDDDFSQIGQPCISNSKIIGNVSGLGSLDIVSSGRTARRELMAAVDKRMCEKHVMFLFPHTMFCAELSDNEGDVLAADLGSPFEVTREGRTYVFGIYSWGQRLARVGFFDYFTKVSPYFYWIKEQLG